MLFGEGEGFCTTRERRTSEEHERIQHGRQTLQTESRGDKRDGVDIKGHSGVFFCVVSSSRTSLSLADKVKNGSHLYVSILFTYFLSHILKPVL